jgi:hypothetical protein
MSTVALPYAVFYETVPVSSTATVLGTTGAKGDIVKSLVITVSTAATSTVALIDNATSYSIMAANTPIGVYTIPLDAQSVSGAWKITTGAGASVLATGQFT